MKRCIGFVLGVLIGVSIADALAGGRVRVSSGRYTQAMIEECLALVADIEDASTTEPTDLATDLDRGQDLETVTWTRSGIVSTACTDIEDCSAECARVCNLDGAKTVRHAQIFDGDQCWCNCAGEPSMSVYVSECS